MLLLDRPYVSDVLRRTVHDHRLPVVLTPAARALGFSDAPGAISEDEAVARLRADPRTRVLSNSEDAIGWVAAHLGFTALPAAIGLLKDKLAFRRLLQDRDPDLRFRELRPEDLDTFDPRDVGHPFVIKPAVGFFSIGVHLVRSPDAWPAVRRSLQADLRSDHRPYPTQVLDDRRFIIEEIITGAEYAIDAYYDADGRPVITNILHHPFGADDSVSDRVYVTGEEVVMPNLARFTDVLADIGRRAGLRDFPVHAEVRVDTAGRVVPIEVNPLRFGGWCTTADLTVLGYGFDPYRAFLEDVRPDWEDIFATRRGKLYGIVVLDDSTGLPSDRISGFDHDAVAAGFSRTLAVRTVDHRRWGVFGFVFTETPTSRRAELDAILHSDLREFVTTRA